MDDQQPAQRRCPASPAGERGWRWGFAAAAAGALVAFAGNSLLTRAAIDAGTIGPLGFTVLRLAGGACCLALLARPSRPGRRQLLDAGFLLVYAACFSVAYRALAAGTGALLLFATVNLSMLAAGRLGGERLGRRAWSGASIGIGGLLYLLAPGLHRPEPLAAATMILAGIGWGCYSLRGRRSATPLRDTAANFVVAALLALPLAPLAWSGGEPISPLGVAQALVSGALCSGLGYALWYRIMPRLGASRAGLLQLVVPLLVALGGVLVLRETLTPRILISAVAILGGVGLVLMRRPLGAADRHRPPKPVIGCAGPACDPDPDVRREFRSETRLSSGGPRGREGLQVVVARSDGSAGSSGTWRD